MIRILIHQHAKVADILFCTLAANNVVEKVKHLTLHCTSIMLYDMKMYKQEIIQHI